jgi:hypothetical protein
VGTVPVTYCLAHRDTRAEIFVAAVCVFWQTGFSRGSFKRLLVTLEGLNLVGISRLEQIMGTRWRCEHIGTTQAQNKICNDDTTERRTFWLRVASNGGDRPVEISSLQ